MPQHRPTPERLPAGVMCYPLRPNRDDRGTFTEVLRVEWGLPIQPRQWNAVSSAAGVLRGVHVHLRHIDYLVLLDGHATIGLRDLRPDAVMPDPVAVELSGDAPAALLIPPGVAHGFLFHAPSIHIYAVSEYWDHADELGCIWNDADLGIPWPADPTKISPRDASLPSFRALMASLPPPASS